MFQTFDDRGGPAFGHTAVPKLRAALKVHGLDAFFVPHEDEWQNEYVPAFADRLLWLTGFTGSAGSAIIARETAVIFVDGRYTLQVRDEVDLALFAVADLVEAGPPVWIKANAKAGWRIGYDPALITPDGLAKLREAAASAGAEMVAVTPNPIDSCWDDRPAEPLALIQPHTEALSGEAGAAKRARLADGLSKAGADAAVLTSPASLAWLFNIRGGDVARTPLALGSALLRSDGTSDLFVRPEKVSDGLRAHLGNEVSIQAPDAFAAALTALSGKTVLADPALSSAAVFEALEASGARIKRGQDPCILPRACKNPVELQGARKAHARDGAALARYLCWLDEHAPTGRLTEIDAAQALERFRAETGALKDLSFDTISGAGPNGAIVHYRVTGRTNRALEPGALFLVDSGGQYLDGTTDVTRTVAIGAPTGEMKDRFTRVLKGHIALARVRFPRGTAGVQLDALARLSLWEAGLDYDHGTGHGVGSYLGVHEGPQRIAKSLVAQPLEPGMIVSNEPGYYKTGAYGIRIENLQAVTEASDLPGGERAMLGFETLTLAPIDRRLVEPGLLTPVERDWLDAYHARVLAEIGPRLTDAHEVSWLEAATAPI
jgi:Xaa-Pro aminopeptidase